MMNMDLMSVGKGNTVCNSDIFSLLQYMPFLALHNGLYVDDQE